MVTFSRLTYMPLAYILIADMNSAHEEEAFLESYDPERWPRPSVAVDLALLSIHEGRLVALFLQRDAPPHRGRWALPGGFVRTDESLDDAARRVLAEKAGLEDVYLEQLYTFGAPDRDPRMRVISVAYYALVEHARIARARAESEGAALLEVHAPWEGLDGGPAGALDADGAPVELAFDHGKILGWVVTRLRGKLDYAALGFQLLPRRFTLRDLQTVHEVVHGRALNKDSFRRRMIASGLIEPTGERESDVLHRPAELYVIKERSAV